MTSAAEDPNWLPALVLLGDYGGSWDRYLTAIYGVFKRDFIETQPRLDGKWIRCARHPLHDDKEVAFWHYISEGPSEDDRTPELRRCERIGWIRAVIENAGDPLIERWLDIKRGEPRHILWLREEFLVVLAERTRQRDGFQYLQFITAYPVDHERRRRKLRADRDSYRNG